MASAAKGGKETAVPLPEPAPPNTSLLRALWSLLHGMWGVLTGNWGVLEETLPTPKSPYNRSPNGISSVEGAPISRVIKVAILSPSLHARETFVVQIMGLHYETLIWSGLMPYNLFILLLKVTLIVKTSWPKSKIF